MRKSGSIVLFIFILINLCVSFATETIKDTDFIENEVVELSEGWTYVDGFWVKPDALDLIAGRRDYSLKKLFEDSSINKFRGTLYKTLIIPEALVGKPFVINNTLFDESFTMYIDGIRYEKSRLLTKHQNMEEGYLFIPSDSKITLTIQFEQGSKKISNGSSLYFGSFEAYEEDQHFIWLSDSLVLSIAIIFLMYLIWQRLSAQVQLKNFLFEQIVLAFILGLGISEIDKMFTFSHFELIRVQLFLGAFISTLVVTYGFKGNERIMLVVKEFGKIYLILFAAGVTIIPIKYLGFLWNGHMVLAFVYVLLCDQYKMQWKLTLAFAYFLGMTSLNLNGILTSNLYMLPILLIVIYKSFFRTIESGTEQKEDTGITLKESYGSDKTELQFKEMVNGVDEGVAVLTADLYIDHAYNEAMQHFFEFDIKHKKITDIIYRDDFDNKLYAETILGRYFEAETENDKKLYLDLLSKKVTISGNILSLKYMIAKDPQYLVVILEDQTEVQNLMNEKVALQEKVDMIFEITRNQSEFKQLYQEFLQFLHQEVEDSVEKSSTVNNYIDNLLVSLEYFNKVFFRFRLINVTTVLQKIISELEVLKKEGGFINTIDVKRYLESFDLDACLSVDLEWLEGVLDEESMKQDCLIMVEESDFIELEKRLLTLPGHESILDLIHKIKHAQNQKLIKKYNQYITELARKLGKKVNPILLEGYETVLNSRQFSDILKSMFYLIDNALIHGIEKPSDRFGMNKSEYGTIKVKFKVLDTFLEITFEDDGRGVDYNGIKDMLYQQNKVPFETLVLLNTESLSDYLFEEGVTTDVENHLGVGLTQLKKEVELQKGNIKIESSLNQFTRVIIRVKL